MGMLSKALPVSGIEHRDVLGGRMKKACYCQRMQVGTCMFAEAKTEMQNEDAGPPLILVVSTVMLGLIMSIIDTSIVNVAIGTMAGNLGASIDEIGWVATGYILANVIVMPLNGWLTARFGRRNFYAASLALFTVSSFLCGTATNVWVLVAYRVLQGIGGGALQPTAQAILFESFPPEKRGVGMAIFGIGAMVGPAVGPALGGILIDNYSWPLIFFINVPIGIVAFFMTLAFIRDQSYVKRPNAGVDWLGLTLLIGGLSATQYLLERGQRLDWFSDWSICVCALLSVTLLGVFIYRQLHAASPLVDLRVFRARSFTGGCLIGVVTGFGLYGSAFVLPLFLQTALGFTATQTGFALIPGALMTMISMPLVSRLMGKIDGRILIAVGMVIFALGSWMLGGLNAQAGYDDILLPRGLQGFALGFLFVPLSTLTLSQIARADMSNATGLYSLVRQLGGSLGIAILQFMQLRYADTAQSGLAGGITLHNTAIAALLANAGEAQRNLEQLAIATAMAAQVISYDMLFRLTALSFIVTLPILLILRSQFAARADSHLR